MKSKILEYFEWDDLQEAICANMGIEHADFTHYHKVLYPDADNYVPGAPYCNCWHVWLKLWGEHLRNDGYDTAYFPTADKPGDKDGEWGYIEEQAVKEYGEWARTFVKAVCKMVVDHDLGDREIVIRYSW